MIFLAILVHHIKMHLKTLHDLDSSDGTARLRRRELLSKGAQRS